MRNLKIGLVGCGAIGTMIARDLDRKGGGVVIAGLYDKDKSRARVLRGLLPHKPPLVSLAALIRGSEVVVECAAQSAVPEVLSAFLRSRSRNKPELIVLSVGAILKHARLVDQAREKGVRFRVPSGAVAGLDGLKGAGQGKIDRVTLTSAKPPLSFAGAPYLSERGVDLAAIKKRTVIFEGTALEAVAAFPANINVAATLSLAGIGPEKTKVRIIADPALFVNVHEVTVEGEFGRMVCRTENLPSAFNPKTSALAGYSALALIRGMVAELRVGT